MKNREIVSISESYTKNIFHAYLEKLSLYKKIEWTPKPKGVNSAPDYHLTLDGNSFSVEVTEINKKQRDGIEPKTFVSSRKRFINLVKKEATRQNLLKGTYDIFFLMPWSAEMDKKTQGFLKREIFEYLKNTQESVDEAPKDIFLNYRRICQVFKISSSSNDIQSFFVDGGWPASNEMQDHVCKMLQDAIDIKIKRLNHFSIRPPRILVLYNNYLLSSPEIFKNCFGKIENASFYHTIFIVMEPKEMSFILYSSCSNWK